MPYLARPSQTCVFFQNSESPKLVFFFNIVNVVYQDWSSDMYLCFITEYTPQNILSLPGKVTLQYGGKRDVFIQFLVNAAIYLHN